MRVLQFWTAASVIVLAGIVDHVPARGAEPGPEQVLKARGLTRNGSLYVLDAERGFLDGMTKIQPRYAEVEALYVKLAAIVRSQAEYDGLDREYALATERLRNVGAEIDAFPSTSNSELKEQYRNLLDLEKQLRFHRNELDRELNLRWKNLVPDWKREELFKEFQSKQQDFLTESRSLRGVAEDVKAQYAKLSRDDAVKKAIATVRLSTKTRIDLGPSAEFKKKSTLLKNAERTFAPESFRPGKTAKKSSRKNKADTSGTIKRGSEPN